MEAEQAKNQAKEPAGRIVMATVKGDVHDIGKNIVGVVLQCNGYEVIDLGVMTPTQKILDAARETKAQHHRAVGPHHAVARRDVPCGGRDGAAGLRYSAADRRRDDQPRAHGRQDRSQLPRGQTVYVTDASRAVGVASSLLSKTARADYAAGVRREYEEIATRHAAQRAPGKAPDASPQARANKLKLDWANYTPPAPTFLGVRTFEHYDLGELVPYIDWTPFFQTWELTGPYPLDPRGRQGGRGRAQSLCRCAGDAGEDRRREMADGQRRVRLLARRRADGDDIVLFGDERAQSRSRRCTRSASR